VQDLRLTVVCIHSRTSPPLLLVQSLSNSCLEAGFLPLVASPNPKPNLELVVSIPESLLNLPKLTGRGTRGSEGAAEGIGICIDGGTFLRVRVRE
jgi:hypothetical protein